MLGSAQVGEVVLDAILEKAKNSPYRIRDGGRGVIVWEIVDGTWREIATFAKRDHAEVFVFAMSEPVLGEW